MYDIMFLILLINKTCLLILVLWFMINNTLLMILFNNKNIEKQEIKKDKQMYNSAYFLLLMIFIQVTLGIFTLLSGAYIWIASLHQISTILLLISSIYFYYNSLKS